jgi:hypothetical protein
MPTYTLHSPHDSSDSKRRPIRAYCVTTEDGRDLPNICLVGDRRDSFWRVGGRQYPAHLVEGAIARTDTGQEATG